MGPGVDPHAYRQTRSDIVATASADLVLWHGLYLEAQMEEFLLELGGPVPWSPSQMRLPRNLLISHDDYEGRFDPHVWMNPNLWSRVVLEDTRRAADVHPDGAVFRANADAYLDERAAWRSTRSKCCPPSPPKAASCCRAHDAFNYFGRGLRVRGDWASRASPPKARRACSASPNWSTCWWPATSARSSSKARSRTATSAR
jgi:manganese/zinc/iron transport system substrate-binding protein